MSKLDSKLDTVNEVPLNGAPEPPKDLVYVGTNRMRAEAGLRRLHHLNLGAKRAPFTVWSILERFAPGCVGSDSDSHYYIPAKHPQLVRLEDQPRPFILTGWITDRLPTVDDTDDGDADFGYVIIPSNFRERWRETNWRHVELGEPWLPYPKAEPYVAPPVTFDSLDDFGGVMPKTVFMYGTRYDVTGVALTRAAGVHIVLNQERKWRVEDLVQDGARWSPTDSFDDSRPFTKPAK